MRGWDCPCGADICVAAFKTTFTVLTCGLRPFDCLQRKHKIRNVWETEKGRNRAGDEHGERGRRKKKKKKRKGKARKATTPPCTCRHWFIILISLISTAAPIFQMSFSNLCQTVWPFFLIQLMTSSVAWRICNSDWVFYRHSSRHTGVFVCLSLSVSAQYFGGGKTGSVIHQGGIGFAAKYVPSGNKTIILS